ncbi:MAG: hypothetical protein NWF06_04470, partial [Candidatus Bathyarchaeota archaeon]|nr:hypothetical protein [Candidatus Bathyarchaeum sp.]
KIDYSTLQPYSVSGRESVMACKSRSYGDHMFSIELKSLDYVKNLSLATDSDETVLIEGFLGKLETIEFTEGIMLEINGTKGILRMDLSKKEWNALLPHKKNRLMTSNKKILFEKSKGR